MLQSLQQKTSGSKLGGLLTIMSMAVTWHRLRVGPTDMYLTRKVSFKDTLVIGMQQGKPSDCAPGLCFGLFYTRCKHPYCSPILHVRKAYFYELFRMFFRVHVTHWLLCQTDEIDTLFYPSSVIYIWEHRWIIMLLLIFVSWYKHYDSNVSGSKSILNRFGCIIWRPKAIFYKSVHIT